jgi:hypothetical protein
MVFGDPIEGDPVRPHPGETSFELPVTCSGNGSFLTIHAAIRLQSASPTGSVAAWWTASAVSTFLICRPGRPQDKPVSGSFSSRDHR